MFSIGRNNYLFCGACVLRLLPSSLSSFPRSLRVPLSSVSPPSPTPTHPPTYPATLPPSLPLSLTPAPPCHPTTPSPTTPPSTFSAGSEANCSVYLGVIGFEATDFRLLVTGLTEQQYSLVGSHVTPHHHHDRHRPPDPPGLRDLSLSPPHPLFPLHLPLPTSSLLRSLAACVSQGSD